VTLPLRGTRVIELTTAWAGPFGGRYMGAMGAEVIKVEGGRSLDLWRGPARVPAPPGGEAIVQPYDRMPNFNALNRNKRGISLDLATEGGRELFLRLVMSADFVLSNMTARVLPNLGLEYEVLRTVRPDVVLLAMPADGMTGPFSSAAGYGTIVEGMGGLGARFGYRTEGARISQTYYTDAVAGIHATVAALAALRWRQQSGEGAYIDLSQQEALWLQLGEGIVHRSLTGRDPGRLGNAEPGCCPSGLYPTSDGRWIALVARDEGEFRALVAAGDGCLQAYAELPVSERVQQRDAIDAAVAGWSASLTQNELLERLRTAGVGVAPFNDYRDAADSSEFTRLGAVEGLDHAVAGPQQYLRVPVRFDGVPVDSQRPAPPFGRHSDEVLRELLGLSDNAIATLRGDGVIQDAPAGA
jgi:crotonobetainyl-CoA:carnitine CoA-transferase CaiB-like acyl-CoA transferase